MGADQIERKISRHHPEVLNMLCNVLNHWITTQMDGLRFINE